MELNTGLVEKQYPNCRGLVLIMYKYYEDLMAALSSVQMVIY